MDESMEIKVAQMIKFDVEDMLPVEYQHRIREEKQPDECSLLLDNDLCDSFSRSNISELDRTKILQKWIRKSGSKLQCLFLGKPYPLYSLVLPLTVMQTLLNIPPGSTANYLTSIDPSQVRAPPSTTII
uniref:Uncharacterized protein n=1 Tax=Ditylenchus dipsaci TaxID=166011 RepID=A0A915EC93_9BILA